MTEGLLQNAVDSEERLECILDVYAGLIADLILQGGLE